VHRHETFWVVGNLTEVEIADHSATAFGVRDRYVHSDQISKHRKGITMLPESRTRSFAHKRRGNALSAKSAGVMCVLALTEMFSAIFAKAALAQDYAGAVYAGTDDGHKNGLVAYGRKADGTLAYIGELSLPKPPINR
jgi:hypothetical protein